MGRVAEIAGVDERCSRLFDSVLRIRRVPRMAANTAIKLSGCSTQLLNPLRHCPLLQFQSTDKIHIGLQVCWCSLLSSRNVRWPRRMLHMVSHGEYADGIYRRTDGRTPDCYITLSAMDAASVIIRARKKMRRPYVKTQCFKNTLKNCNTVIQVCLLVSVYKHWTDFHHIFNVWQVLDRRLPI